MARKRRHDIPPPHPPPAIHSKIGVLHVCVFMFLRGYGALIILISSRLLLLNILELHDCLEVALQKKSNKELIVQTFIIPRSNPPCEAKA